MVLPAPVLAQLSPSPHILSERLPRGGTFSVWPRHKKQ